ncbi:MAG: cytochrome c3 family protein [Methylococcales bacterium]
MRVHIDSIKRRKKGGVVRKTAEFNGDIVTIGRGTDQVVFIPELRAAYDHAEIYQARKGEILVRSQALSGIKLNGVSTQKSVFNLADCITIGRWEIRRVSASDDYDLALELEKVVSQANSDSIVQQQIKSTLALVGPNKRHWSWILVASVLIWFLALPLLGKVIPGLENVLKSVPGLPSDTVWNTGDLSSAHHFFRQDCTTCHQNSFIRVEDQACIDCHQNTHAHADLKFNEVDELNEMRCASCHEEHNGSLGLVMRDDSFCADCHTSLQQFTNNQTRLLDASNFGSDHPEFRASIPHLENGKVISRRVSLDNKDQLKEQLTIYFSHKAHLKPEGVHQTYDSDRQKNSGLLDTVSEDADRVIMQCADCHTFDRGQVATKQINFEQHCSECHRLDFETSDKQRELPHGDVMEVLYYLQQYYQNKALKGMIEDPQAPLVARTRRRPGQVLSVRQRQTAIAWAEGKTRDVAMEVFQFRVCKTCHDVQYASNGSPPWSIPPVSIPEHWMPLANFSHQKHVTVACDDCHQDIDQSEDGTDVLLPSIKVCRDCHAGEDDTSRLSSNCVDCHGFHVGEQLLGQQQQLKQQVPSVNEKADAVSNTIVPDDSLNPAGLEGSK